MASPHETLRTVRITASSGKESSGEVRLRVWTSQERTKKALKMLGLCWGLAILLVPIPLIHFTLLPGLLIAGPYLALWTYHRISTVEGGMGICPDCRAPIPFGKRTEKWPASDVCTHCRNAMKIELQSATEIQTQVDA